MQDPRRHSPADRPKPSTAEETAPHAERVRESTDEPRLDTHRTSVFIVDDCVDTADSLALLLSLRGYLATPLHSAKDLRELALAARPNLILLDLVMPQVDGYSAADELRAEPALQDTWIVAMTGYANPRDVRNGNRETFDAHLLKPVDFDALERILRRVRRVKRPAAARAARRTVQ